MECLRGVTGGEVVINGGSHIYVHSAICGEGETENDEPFPGAHSLTLGTPQAAVWCPTATPLSGCSVQQPPVGFHDRGSVPWPQN